MAKEAVSLQEMLWRATSGRVPETASMLAASTMYFINADAFWVWASLNAPQAEAVVEESEYDRRVMRLGREFEARWVRENFPYAVKVEPERGPEALRHTLHLMRIGERAIYQPTLVSVADELHGRGDLIVRVDDTASDLGPFSYRVIEVKRSSAPSKPHHRLQAAVYTKILGRLQGRMLDFDVALPSGVERVEFERVRPGLESAISAWKQMKSGAVMPLPRGPGETKSPWQVYGSRLLEEWQDATLLPDVGAAARERIRHRLGVATIPELARFSLNELIVAMGDRRGRSLFYHVQARCQGKPVLLPGTSIKLPRGKRTFDLDYETCDDAGGSIPPHVFLAGLWDYQRDQFVRFEARGATQEEAMFKSMLEYLGDLDGVCVRMWSSFEHVVTRKKLDQFPKLRSGLSALLNSFVDLKESVKRCVALPVSSYSIKEVAPALGFSWPDAGVDAFACMTGYFKLLENGETDEWEKALRYHEADVRAMKHIDDFLSKFSSAG